MKRILLLSIIIISIVSIKSYSQVGPTGPTGPTGPAGRDGYNGQNGMDGANGATGVCGAAGRDGTNGATGVQGIQGATGTQGIQGDTGPTGSSGVAGITGATGATGIAGATGAKGATGATGNNGTNSVAGSSGEIQFNVSSNFGSSVSYKWVSPGCVILGTSNTTYTLSYTNTTVGSSYVEGKFYYNRSGAQAGDLLQWSTNNEIIKVTPVGIASYLQSATIPYFKASDINPEGGSANQILQRKSDNSGVQWTTGTSLGTYIQSTTIPYINATDLNPTGASANQIMQRKSDNSGTQWSTGTSLGTYNNPQLISQNYQCVVTNATGGASITGTLLQTSTTANLAVMTCSSASTAVIGVMISSGIANGSQVKIAKSGIIDVLLKDSVTSPNYSITAGDWIETSTVAGRGHKVHYTKQAGYSWASKYVIGVAMETKSITSNDSTIKVFIK